MFPGELALLAIVGPVLSIVVSITREDVRKAISHDSSAAGFALLRQHGGLRSHRVYQKKKNPTGKDVGKDRLVNTRVNLHSPVNCPARAARD